MAAKQTKAEMAALGRLCGIALEYWDNFGVRRRTSRATLEGLLMAMGVPCGALEKLRPFWEEYRSRLLARLLPPMTIITPGRGQRLVFYYRPPRSGVPSGLELEAEFIGENGEVRRWLPHPGQLRLEAFKEGGKDGVWRLSLALPPGLAEGYYQLSLRIKGNGREQTGSTYLAVCPRQAWMPPVLEQGRRLWGLNLPLYALRSRHNWGIGDFGDLRTVTSWAGELGAAFVGINPLHAPQVGDEADPSPYSPSSRLFLNFLYVSLEDVPEMRESREAQALWANPAFQADLARLRQAPLVAYPEIRRLKRKFLELLFQAFLQRHGSPAAPLTPRGEEFVRFVGRDGWTLEKFSLYQALTEHQKEKDWRRWPEEFQRPDTAAVAAFAEDHRQELWFHQYVQWLAAAQRQAVWEEAIRAGLPFTLYQDLALGAAPGGFETWGYPGLFARGAAIGSPPDAFNLKGQNWALPPLIPKNLAESGYRLFIDVLRANLPPGGIIRLDHVMGLFRLFWIPEGMPPGEGAYVRYPAQDLIGLLALESHRARTLVIGEDLGTVAPGIRRDLARARIFSYRVFYFERTGENRFKAPEDYPCQAIACATTHDLPTLAGYWEGQDLESRRQLHLYPTPQSAEHDEAVRRQDRLLLVQSLVQAGLLPPDYAPPPDGCPEELRRAVLAYLGKSRAALVEVRLEDILGLTAQQNLPGTTDQHPNWRQKILPTLEELRRDPEVLKIAATLRQARAGDGRKG
ncbi:MAG: 4-alpha-glucanotransferase [Desulfobaccales bacterium]